MDNIYQRAAAEAIGKSIREQQEKLAKMQAEDAENKRKAAEAKARQEVSRKELAAWVGREVQRRTVLGGLSPDLVQEYANSFSDPSNVIWELTHEVLKSPIYGIEQSAEGYQFNGKTHSTVQDLAKELKGILGDYGSINGPDYTEGLLYAMATGEKFPVSHAIANINHFPTNLERPEADKLYKLTKYHHKLGSLLNGGTPQRPQLSETSVQEASDSASDQAPTPA